MRLFSELRRRNVFRMAVLYVVAAWLIMQVAEVIVTLADLPPWSGQMVLAVLAVGFPIALVFSWFYELTPEGIALEKDVDRAESITHVTGRRMDFVVIAMLVAALLLFAYDKWWIGPPPEKSIAVLPFENLSGDPDQEYFSDGMSEELLNMLAQLPGLRVAARTSSFQFKGQHEDVADIAAELNVAHILDGSVRKSGNRLRITAQLVKAHDGFHLWSQTYDRELDDVFAVQGEIAEAIGDALRVKLALVEDELGPPAATELADTDAYDAYLRGRELIHDRNRESLETAIQHLERSLRLDDGYAPAHAQLAIATMLLTSYAESDREAARRKGVRHLDRAQEIEPDLADAHAGRTLFALYAQDYESTIEHARKALAENPNHIDVLAWLYNALIFLDRGDEAHVIHQRMLMTDPLSIRSRRYYIRRAHTSGRIEEAHSLADQLVAKNPSVGYDAHANLSWDVGELADALSWALRASRHHVYAMEAFLLVGEFDEARRIETRFTYFVDIAEGRWDDAIQRSRKLVQQYPNSAHVIVQAAEILYLAGRYDEALPLYERALDLTPEGRPIDAWSTHFTMQLALVRRKAGDEEAAQEAAELVRRFHAERSKTWATPMSLMVDAMVAAFEQDRDRAITALESAVRHGGRWYLILDDPIFEELWDQRRFIALRKELDTILAQEHEKILQLVCFNNPVPDEWQPMPETCDGVAEKGR